MPCNYSTAPLDKIRHGHLIEQNINCYRTMDDGHNSISGESFDSGAIKTLPEQDSHRVKDISKSTNISSESDHTRKTTDVVESSNYENANNTDLKTGWKGIDNSNPPSTDKPDHFNSDSNGFRRESKEDVKDKPQVVDGRIKKSKNIIPNHIAERHSMTSLGEINDASGPRHAFFTKNNRKMSVLDLAKLKETTARLHLETRRPSFVAWRSEHLEKWSLQDADYIEDSGQEIGTGDGRIDKVLESLRQDLTEMKQTDQMLARQLLLLRKDIYKVKMIRTCSEHQEILREVQENMAEIHELSELCDIPFDTLHPLQHVGVTRLNFHERRFSTS